MPKCTIEKHLRECDYCTNQATGTIEVAEDSNFTQKHLVCDACSYEIFDIIDRDDELRDAMACGVFG